MKRDLFWKRAGYLILTILIVFFVFFSSAGQIYRFRDTQSLSRDIATWPKFDAIVVLAGARGRIAEAADVWVRIKEAKAAEAPFLYFSGMGPHIGFADLERLVKPDVFQKFDREKTFIENLSFNTVENARMLQNKIDEQGWNRILLMTSVYHMRRARFTLERILGPQVKIDTLSIPAESFDGNTWRSSQIGIEITLQEYLKFLYYTNIL